MYLFYNIKRGCCDMDNKGNTSSFSFKEITVTSNDLDVEVQYFNSVDGIKIAYYKYLSEKPIATLIFLHGGGAHSKMGYQQLAERLKSNFAINTYLMDIRGHGFSEGKRGDAPNKESVYSDISSLIKLINENTDLPLFLGGHSSGAGLCLNYSSCSKSDEISGYFFVSPEFGYKSKSEKNGRVPFAKVKVGDFILNSMSGGLLKAHEYAVSFNYPSEIIKSQPLIVEAITVNMANAMTPYNPTKQFQNITKPIGLFIGQDDELFDVDKILAYGKLAQNSKARAKAVEDQNHLSILNVINFEIGNSIIEWLK